MTSSGLAVDVRKIGFMSKWLTVLEASGEVSVSRGDTVSIAQPDNAWSVIASEDFNIDEVDEVEVSVRGEDFNYFEFSAGFSIPESGLSSTEWLHTDGSMTELPCEGEF